MQTIYLDYAATTPVDERVWKKMKPWLTQHFGNPSSIHKFGQAAKNAIEESRALIASYLQARPSEIVFTGSGSEADNLAIKGYAYANRQKGNHLITSVTEHSAILKTMKKLENDGFEVTYLDVDSNGKISLDDLQKALKPSTILISIMMVNNETGVLHDLKQIGRLAHEHGVVFHSDTVQALGKFPIHVNELPVDLLSFSAHKLYAPKGIGALFVRQGIRIQRQIDGGGQERARRAGTENVAGIVAFAEAVKLCYENLDNEEKYIRTLRDLFEKRVLEEIPDVSINGSTLERSFTHSNLSFERIEGESLLLALDMKNIAVSAGSACSSGSIEPSHVLTAMAKNPQRAMTSIRFSFGRFTTQEEVNYTVDQIKSIVKHLRSLIDQYDS